MCSTSEAYHQYQQEFAEQVRHVISTNEDVLWMQGTSLAQMKMPSTREVYHQYEREFARQVRYIISTNEDAQYKRCI